MANYSVELEGSGHLISRLPTAEEINVFDSLDERWAVKNFLGKDLDQAQALFRENFLHHQEDLMGMGPKAFCFYVPAAVDYLLSTESDGDSDAASSFCSLIEWRLDYDPAEITAARQFIRDRIPRILKDFKRFNCVFEIHDDLAARYRALLKLL